ncbi:hypothetical protein [Micromonospora sp. BL4]|uniref:hypothetical protein n=1 Tax=Micromonospora sp. BL4 TaxID=2478710 RepID=UPI001F23F48B|nr:hypothetical protein [Micromonospora sp. BL4]
MTVPLPSRATLPAAGLAALLLLPLTACAGADEGSPTAATSASGTPTSAATSTSTAPTTRGESTPAVPASPVPPSGRFTTPPLSRTVPPSLGTPPKPRKPTEPSDLLPTNLVAGHVTRGGSGPCYGFVSEDGVEYALHGADAGALAQGSFVTLRISARSVRINCGPGVPASIVPR